MACHKFRKQVTMPQKHYKHTKNSVISFLYIINPSHNSEANEKDSSLSPISNKEDSPKTLSASSNKEDSPVLLDNKKKDSDETPSTISKKKR